MEHQQICEGRRGKLVHQIPRDVTFYYNLHLGHYRDCLKGFIEEYNSENCLHYPFSYIINMNYKKKFQWFYEPWSSRLVRQLPRGITFPYDISLGHTKECWKFLTRKYNSEEGLHHAFGYGVP